MYWVEIMEFYLLRKTLDKMRLMYVCTGWKLWNFIYCEKRLIKCDLCMYWVGIMEFYLAQNQRYGRSPSPWKVVVSLKDLVLLVVICCQCVSSPSPFCPT